MQFSIKVRITRGCIANTTSVVQHCDTETSVRTQEVSTRIIFTTFILFSLASLVA